MTISAYKVENILKQYTRQILPENKTGGETQETLKSSSQTDTVSISQEGKERIKERFQSEIINYLREKY